MIEFVVCDDNKYVRNINERIISKVAMPYDFNYTVYSYEKYNLKFKKLIESAVDIRIYILDLELPGKTGIDIAREIRKSDWDSIIIILTSHDELELKLYKEKLLILDFISKFDNYEKRLIKTLNIVLNKINTKKIITFKSKKELHHVNLDNIYYIYKDNLSDKSVIVTNNDKFPVNETLSSLSKKLDDRFYQTHRACYVNTTKIDSVDFKNSIIYFDNKKSTDYLSRNNKKGLREKL